MQTKPFWAEREFIFAVGATLGGIILLAQGKTDAGTTLLTGAVVGYGVSRGLAKAGTAGKKDHTE